MQKEQIKSALEYVDGAINGAGLEHKEVILTALGVLGKLRNGDVSEQCLKQGQAFYYSSQQTGFVYPCPKALEEAFKAMVVQTIKEQNDV